MNKENTSNIDATVIVYIKYTADFIIDVLTACFKPDYSSEKFYYLKYSVKILK